MMIKATKSYFNIILSCLLIIFATGTVAAQKIQLFYGSLSSLRGVKSYDIAFRYDSMMIGERTPEKEYLDKKKADWDAKEQGKGSRFVSMWFDDRKKLYEPAFIKALEELGEIKAGDQNAKYTLLLKTQSTEGGWDIGVMDHPPYINGEMWIVESADQSKVVAKILFIKLAGDFVSGYDFDLTRRIASSYTDAGKKLGYYLRRKTK